VGADLFALVFFWQCFPTFLSCVLACCAADYAAYVGFFLLVHGNRRGRRLQGRLLRYAQPADTPLLTAKYEPDITLGGVLQSEAVTGI